MNLYKKIRSIITYKSKARVTTIKGIEKTRAQLIAIEKIIDTTRDIVEKAELVIQADNKRTENENLINTLNEMDNKYRY